MMKRYLLFAQSTSNLIFSFGIKVIAHECKCNLVRKVLGATVNEHSFRKFSSFAPVKIFESSNPKIMKLDTPEFKSIFTPELKVLQDLFETNGFELRVAGGAVRDLLMNKTPHDLDFATTATPEQMKEMFTKENIRMINVQGEKHGTITPRINDKENFEITTLRTDVITDGRHAEVEFTTDWQVDANRRDLTINSMFLGLDGTVYDYFSGYDDLLNHKVLFVGDPNIRIQEDYLRILRYFRFYGRISKEPDNHDKNTLLAIERNASGLQKISGERIWSELQKILEGNFAEPLLKTMLELGIGSYIGLPQNPNLEELTKVFSRVKEKLRASSVIASLLRTQDEVLKFHARCRLPNFDRDLCLFIVENREDKISALPIRPYQQIVARSKLKTSDIVEFVTETLRYRGDVELLEEFKVWKVPRFPVSGTQLRERGVPPGKTFGLVLMQMKEIWLQQDFTPTAEELLVQLPAILDQLGVKTKK